MTANATAVETKQRPWWLMLIEGIALFVIAAVLLWAPLKTRVNAYMLLVQLLGLYWVIQGIFNIVAMFVDHKGWGWKLFIGIVSIIAGGYILMYPIASRAGVAADLRVDAGHLGPHGRHRLADHGLPRRRLGSRHPGRPGDRLRQHPDRELLVPGMGLTMIWVAAVWGLIGGMVMVVQAFRLRKA